jgi:hypothetical protein
MTKEQIVRELQSLQARAKAIHLEASNLYVGARDSGLDQQTMDLLFEGLSNAEVAAARMEQATEAIDGA